MITRQAGRIGWAAHWDPQGIRLARSEATTQFSSEWTSWDVERRAWSICLRTYATVRLNQAGCSLLQILA
jgi:hypothetical protein